MLDVSPPPVAADSVGPIADSVWTEQDARRRAIGACAEVARAMAEGSAKDALLRIAASQLSELLAVSRCSVFLREGEAGLFRGRVAHGDQVVDRVVSKLVAGVEADGFTREIVATRTAVVLADAQHDPRAVRSTMRAWGIRSILGVPMVLRGEVVGIFFLDCEGVSHAFSSGDRELALAFADLVAITVAQCERRDGGMTVQRENQLRRRAAAVDERLHEALLAQGGLGEIAAAVSELSGKSAVICDPGLRPLAACVRESDSQLGSVDSILADHAVAAAVAKGALDKPAVIGPLSHRGAGLRLLIAPVRVRDVDWAKVVLLEHSDPFTAADALLVRRAAPVVALEISAARRAEQGERSARVALARDLIHGSGESAQLIRRAAQLAIPLDQPRVVCVVRTRDSAADGPAAEAVAAAVGELTDDAAVLVAATDEGVAVILGLADEESPDGQLARAKATVEAACQRLGGGIVAGVSMRCLAADDFKPAYQQVRELARFVATHGAESGASVLGAQDLGAARLLLRASPVEVERFTDETIGPLLGEDVSRSLLETLAAFLDGRSVRESAHRLGVHPNTVRYRLTRMQDLTGFDFIADGDAQLSAQIALLALRVRGEVPLGRGPSPRRAAPGSNLTLNSDLK